MHYSGAGAEMNSKLLRVRVLVNPLDVGWMSGGDLVNIRPLRMKASATNICASWAADSRDVDFDKSAGAHRTAGFSGRERAALDALFRGGRGDEFQIIEGACSGQPA